MFLHRNIDLLLINFWENLMKLAQRMRKEFSYKDRTVFKLKMGKPAGRTLLELR